MDSYSYVNLLPGNGTGQPPEDDAVWNDMSFDGNDLTDTLSPTYVSSDIPYSGLFPRGAKFRYFRGSL